MTGCCIVFVIEVLAGTRIGDGIKNGMTLIHNKFEQILVTVQLKEPPRTAEIIQVTIKKRELKPISTKRF